MARTNQTGSILLPVTLIGLVSSLLVIALIQNSLYLEQVAVENEAAKSRAYWANVGHFRYALSRARHAGFCDKNDGCPPDRNISDPKKATVLQGYLNEISTYRTFTYPDENSGYSITINLTAAFDDGTPRNGHSGYMMITSSYPTVGVSTLPVLSGLAQRFTPWQLRFCTSLTSAYANCGALNVNNNDGNPTGLYSLRRLVRLPSVL